MPETHLEKLKRIGVIDYLAQNESFAVKLSQVCGNPHPRYVVNGDKRKLAEATAQLLDWGATFEQLQEFRERWKFDDDPWVSQVVGQWGRFLSGKQPKKASRNGHKPAKDHRTDIEKRGGRTYSPEEWNDLLEGRDVAQPGGLPP